MDIDTLEGLPPCVDDVEEVLESDASSSSSSDSSSESDIESRPTKKAFNRLTFHADSAEDVLAQELMQVATTGTCDLHNTQLTELPRPLLDAALRGKLTKLTLGSNRIAQLPDELFELHQTLVDFDCQSNALTSLPLSLMRLPHLQTLLLDYNGLAALPTGDVEPSMLLPSLVTLGVEWNDLREFPSDIVRHCHRLGSLFITENEHVCSTNVPSTDVFTERGSHAAPLTIKLDNRPRVIRALASIDKLPGVTLQWNTIYPDRVLEHLYLGSVRTAQCLSVYHDLNIKYVLTAAKEVEARVEEGMKHFVLLIDDVPEEDIRPVFDKSFAFIEEARSRDVGVLIHCFAGRSRSVTVTVAYLMRYMNLTRDAALTFVRASRPSAHPNEGFMRALERYERELTATQPRVAALPPPTTMGDGAVGWSEFFDFRA